MLPLPSLTREYHPGPNDSNGQDAAFRGRAVPNQERRAGLYQIERHGLSHDTETDETYVHMHLHLKSMFSSEYLLLAADAEPGFESSALPGTLVQGAEGRLERLCKPVLDKRCGPPCRRKAMGELELPRHVTLIGKPGLDCGLGE